MRKIAATILAALLATFAAPAAAAGELEILQLRHRSADEVLEALRPLLEQGGSISGMGTKVMIRASAANRAELRKALAALDTALRRLTITVVHDNATAAGRGGRTWSSRAATERSDQRVQVIEGGSALISVGYALPVPLRQVAVGPAGAIVSEAIVYRDLGSGFLARPRLAGDRVTLEISPQQAAVSATDPAAVRSLELVTTVSGRLGEWIELGAANQDLSAVLLKVEELP
jgi:type II secretory pathway component GspD/PulD (secretin)